MKKAFVVALYAAWASVVALTGLKVVDMVALLAAWSMLYGLPLLLDSMLRNEAAQRSQYYRRFHSL